jgi:hypothetical protein
MGCLGVHFAISTREAKQFLSAQDDAELAELVEEIEEEDDSRLAQPSDKAWDAMHRVLSGGSLRPEGGSYPLNHTILGGQHLYQGDDYFVVYVSPQQVQDVAKALLGVEKSWFREQYFQIDPDDYAMRLSEQNFEYTWSNFEDVRRFYQKAAKKKLAVLFTVDQ